jgi:hypothetical protein
VFNCYAVADILKAHPHTHTHLPYVVGSSSTVQEHIFGRLKILGPVWYRSLGPADEFAGARTSAILLSILVEVYELVQGSKGHRSETEIVEGHRSETETVEGHGSETETVELLSSVNTVLKLFTNSVSN